MKQSFLILSHLCPFHTAGSVAVVIKNQVICLLILIGMQKDTWYYLD